MCGANVSLKIQPLAYNSIIQPNKE